MRLFLFFPVVLARTLFLAQYIATHYNKDSEVITMALLKPVSDSRRLLMLKIDEVFPNENQPRKYFDEYELSLLAESIRQSGIIQPLSVRKIDNGFELIAGERRLRAAKMAGLKKIPCLLYGADEVTSALYGIIENLQRSDLTVFEEAEGINRLIAEFGISHCDVASRLGIAQSTLSNKLRILRLSEEQRRRIVAARLSERHARALIRLPDDIRDDALSHIIAESLTLKETEAYIEKLLNPDKSDQKSAVLKKQISDIRIFANSLSRLVDTMVSAGLDAKKEKRENKNFIEYKIKIQKNSTQNEQPLQIKLADTQVG